MNARIMFHSLRLAALATLFVGVLNISAQPSPDEKKDKRTPRERQIPRGERPVGGLQPGAARGQLFPMMERVLTEEQKESLRAAMETQREKTRALDEKIRDARRELFKAGLTDSFDEESIRAKAIEVGKLDAELTVLRAKAFSKMKPSLSAEQIEQLKNPPPFAGEGGEGRPANARRPSRSAPGERDENDLPSKPRAIK